MTKPARPEELSALKNKLNPEIVSIIHAGHTERESWVIPKPFPVHPIHVERRIRHHEVEPIQTPMRIFVVAVRLPYIAFQSVDSEVHLAEPNRLCDPFCSVNTDLIVPVLSVVMDKLGTLDEHTARAARWVQNPSLERLYNLYNQFHERGRCKELAAPLFLLPWQSCLRNTRRSYQRHRPQCPSEFLPYPATVR